jgi:hypothetical protein
MKLRSFALLTIALVIPAFAQKTASSDESIKIIALNSIMSTDPDRGMPLLEDILKGSSSTGMKDRAMALLTQSKSPRAQEVLAGYAKSAADPELQVRAIRYIGRSGTKDAQQQLASIYPAASDTRAKQEIIRSLMVSGGGDPLLAIAKAEKDPTLRNEAIRDLAMSEGTPVATLTAFYASETDVSAKKTIVSGLANRGDAKTVIELARKETDPTMKAYMVQRLSVMQKNKDAMDYMLELLK